MTDSISELESLFEKNLADSVSSLLGDKVRVSHAAVAAPDGPQLWFRSGLKLAEHGYLAFGAPRALWLEVGEKILIAAGDEQPDPKIVMSTMREIGSQVTGSILTWANQAFSKHIALDELDVAESGFDLAPDAHIGTFTFSMAGMPEIPVTFVVPRVFLQTLVPKPAAPSPSPAPADSAATVGSTVDAKKLELLMDVEMPVSVSIGRSQMLLKDVIKLTTGSVVELARGVTEPVEIVVNNCVIARGDVVVVEGNFGVRIREVLSKEDRMRRLGPR